MLGQLGIEKRLLAGFVLVMAAFIGLNMAMVLWHESTMLMRETELHARALASNIVTQARPALRSHDYSSLEHIALSALEASGVVYATIANQEGEVLASSTREAIELSDPQVLDLVVPVTGEWNGDSWGTVRLGFDLRPVRSELRRTGGMLALSGLGVFLLAVLGLTLFARRMARPLGRLHRRMLELVGCPELPEAPSDGVTALARGFELMAKRLSEEREQRAELLLNLEREVERRTAAWHSSELRYENLFARVKDAVYVCDGDDRLVLVNPAAENLFCGARAELVGRSVAELYVDGAVRQSLLEKLEASGFVVDHETELKRGDGQVRRVLESCVQVREADGSIFTEGVIKDVTALYELQAQLVHAQKMETVGTLAGGVAHDFNNILAGILTSAQLLRLDKDGSASARELARLIEREAERGAKLTQHILNLARRDPPQIRPLDLNQFIREVAELIRQAMKSEVDVRIELADDLLVVEADRVQLQQVFMNLALNARDAMPQGGVFAIRSERIAIEETVRTKRANLGDGPHARITVSDTGRGIASEIRNRVFEPFFTTKPAGQGTGLGLSMVYGIIRNHHGDIVLDTGSRQGTLFTLHLPLTSQRLEQEADSLASGQSAGRLLIIDDEPALRSVVAEALASFGYSVDIAEDGLRGIERFRTGAYDLVLLDMCMPVLDGRQTFLELRRLDPRARVVLISGYADGRGIEETLASGALCLVKKPFKLQHLLTAVRHGLEGVAA